jgi:hypothetical protein
MARMQYSATRRIPFVRYASRSYVVSGFSRTVTVRLKADTTYVSFFVIFMCFVPS